MGGAALSARSAVLVLVLGLAGVLLPGGSAIAGTTGGDDGSIPVEDEVGYQGNYESGRTTVQLLASEAAGRLVWSHGGGCTYPERWITDVETYGEDSVYYPMIADLHDPDTGEWDLDRFGAHDWDVTHSSCVQVIYQGIDSCTDEERIGVRSLAMRYDTRLGRVVGNLVEFGIDEAPETVCVEIIDIEGWRGMIEDSDEIPDPIRATFPQYRTLVGLANSVWYEVEADQDRYHDGFTVHLPTPGGRDWTVDVQAWLEELAIDVDGDEVWDYTVTCSTGDPESVVDCGGTLDEPLYSFMYDDRGIHAFTIEARWAGIGTGPTGEIHDLDPQYLTRQYTFDWETVEVRSSLDS